MNELTKQAIEQPLHFAWAWGGTAVAVAALSAPQSWLRIAGLSAGVANACVIVIREIDQWPSSRWYDPPLDWGFFLSGALAAILWWPGV